MRVAKEQCDVNKLLTVSPSAPLSYLIWWCSFKLNYKTPEFERGTTYKKMIELKNCDRYLSQEIIEQIFTKGIITTCDKRLCGNGASHGFLKSHIPTLHTNLLIQPNRATVEDKENEYLKGEFKGKKMAFLYEGSKVDLSKQYDVIVTVADSFNYNFRDILSGRNIYRVLIDEQHTREANTGFRKSTMFNLTENLERIKTDCAITTITATPNTFSKVDTVIINKDTPVINILTSYNFNKTVERVVSHIKKGQKVIVNTQSKAVIKLILDEAERTDFLLMSGDGLRANLCKTGEYDMDCKDSNIIFCSSAAWEGWSDYSKKIYCFSFIDPKSTINSMTGANVYQAINRPRLGSTYCEVCFFTAQGFVKKFYPNLRDILTAFINEKSKPHKKQKTDYRFRHNGNRYRASSFKEFIHYKTDKEGNTTIHILEDAVNMHLERNSASYDYFATYSQLFKDRNVIFSEINEDKNSSHSPVRISKSQRINNAIYTLPFNSDIYKLVLYPHIPTNTVDLSKQVITNLDIAKSVLNEIGESINVDTTTVNKAYDFLTNDNFEKDFLNIAREGGKYSKKETDKWVKDENIFEKIHSITYQIVKQEITYTRVGHRLFSDVVGFSIPLLEYICSNIGLKFLELDISTAYPTMVFRACGLDVPFNFYGTGAKRKKNKIAVNTVLNMIHTPTDEALKNELRKMRKPESIENIKYLRNEKRKELVKRLKRYFPDEVVTFLMDKFYTNNYDKGAFYEWATFHELNIIKLASKAIEKDNKDLDGFFTRRHDSLVFFHKQYYIETRGAEKIEYMGYNNWFNPIQEKVEKIPEKITPIYRQLELVA